jgi:hypothetical protein
MSAESELAQQIAWLEEAIGVFPDAVLERLILLMCAELQARLILRQHAEEAQGLEEAPVVIEDEPPF